MGITSTLKTLGGSINTLADVIDSNGDVAAELKRVFKAKNALEYEVLALETDNIALKRENFEMQKRIDSLENALQVESSYQLKTFDSGAVVCTKRNEVNGPQNAMIYYCANCVGKPDKPILQAQKPDFHLTPYECPECHSTVFIPNEVKMDVQTITRSSKWDGFI